MSLPAATQVPAGWAELAELRQGLYRFLAAALLQPDAERLDSLAAAVELLADLGVDDFSFAREWAGVVAALDAVPDPATIESDYARLFLVGRAGPPCPPMEGEYLPRTGCGAAEALGDLGREYGAIGLQAPAGTPYPADHVATELEAMSVLCHEEAHAWDEDRQADAVALLRREWGFLDRHLAAWVPRFARRVRAADGGFYAAVATATDAFVRHDHELVATLTRAKLDGADR